MHVLRFQLPTIEATRTQREVLYIQYSQIVLAFSLLLCTFISPKYLFSSDQGGVSNYAVHAATAVPITIGFLGCALLLFLAGRGIDAQKLEKKQPLYLKTIASGYVLVLLSTYQYQHGAILDHVHNYASSAFAILLLIVALAYTRRNHFDVASIAATLTIIAGFVVAIATLAGKTHLLFTSQLLVGIGFGVILVHTSRTLLASLR